MTAPRAVLDPIVVSRQNELFDLYHDWSGDGDPDDDPEFVDAAREIMGLPPLESVEDPGEPTEEQQRTLAAAGVDITPGDDQLHHWWVYGKGRTRWSTWTELYDQLAAIAEIGPAKAKRFASAWFHERYGYYSGSDVNRVRHGKPPRGERVGPG